MSGVPRSTLSEMRVRLQKQGMIKFENKSWTCIPHGKKNLAMRSGSTNGNGAMEYLMNHYRLLHRDLFLKLRREILDEQRQRTI